MQKSWKQQKTETEIFEVNNCLKKIIKRTSKVFLLKQARWKQRARTSKSFESLERGKKSQ